MQVGIREAARILGVSLDTLRRWEKAGKIKSERTPGGHRRYDLAQLRSHIAQRLPEPATTQLTLAYVSASDPAILRGQSRQMSDYCDRQGWKFELIKDAGHGWPSAERDRDVQRSAAATPSDNNPVQTLIKHISSGAAARLVIPDSTAFHRLGPDLLLPLCAQFHVEIVIANLSD